MSELRFSEDHEWVRLDDDSTATIGITDFAQNQLGDVVYVELPEVGREVTQGEEAAVIESVKAASDVKMPLSGTVTAVNEILNDSPEQVNQAPLGDGWFVQIKLSNKNEFDQLMDESAYRAFVQQKT